MNRRGQITIFVIIGIVLVAGVISYFIFKPAIQRAQIPASLEPVYTTFLNCIKEDALVGIDVLESQGGYINMPKFEPGSTYMPFSSQLNFLGNPIPYWYYVSGNNIQKEQVPTTSDMESELEDFVEGKIRGCIFDSYYSQGISVVMAEPQAEVTINDNSVEVNLNMDFGISLGEESALVSKHNIQVNSELGKLYNSAKKVYDYEQNTLFLENYAIDTMRLYAPVDGVELTCAPKVWVGQKVFDDLSSAIELNTISLRNKNGDYKLADANSKYFVLDFGVDENVRFLNSKDWPKTFEVSPTDGATMIANVVGNQPGLGALGFCYVPYHFVYSIKYPVLAQIYSDNSEEIFQFPMAVVIERNLARKPLEGNSTGEVREFCNYKNTKIKINVYDSSLNPVDADIFYSCFGENCRIGKTSDGVLEEDFPQCANGFLSAKADGFAESQTVATTINSGEFDIILDKLYEKQIKLNLDGKEYNGEAIISFSSDKVSQTISYPSQKSISIAEGQYDVSVHIYKNSSITLQAVQQEKCFEVPRSGLGGIFGLTSERCVNFEIPSQIISNVLSGGGMQKHYILESDLIGSSGIEIGAESLKTPTTLEQLQENYVLFEGQNLDIQIK